MHFNSTLWHESWTLYGRHFKALEAYHVKCLQAILGVRWWHKVTHSDLRRRAKVQSMECMVMQRQLRWVRHIRMSTNRLPRRLYSELQEGRHSHGGQMNLFSDNVKLLLKKCQMPSGQLEALAADRVVWRDVCKNALAMFSANYYQEAEVRLLRRHTISSPPTAGPYCHICDRFCASDFGLRSHLRIHNRPSSTS